jgi:opacity protein-like surface antigen
MNNSLFNNKCLIALISANLIAVNTAVGAREGPQNTSLRIDSGPYIGIGAGANIAQYSNGNLSDRIQAFNFHMSKYAPAMNFLAGYAFRLHEWHVGIEVDYMLGNINSSFNHQFGDNKKIARLKSSDAFGAALRLGYHCDRILTYIRLGIENRSFHVIANISGINPQVIARNTIDTKTRKTAFTPGLGLQFSINRNVSASLEYRIALYNKVSSSLFSQIDQNTTAFSIRPYVSSIMVSLRFHF